MTPAAAIPPVASGWQRNHVFFPPQPRHIVLIDSVCVCLTAGRNTNRLESLSLSTTVWRWLTPIDTRERENERREMEGGKGEGLRKKGNKKEGRENLMQRRRRWRR